MIRLTTPFLKTVLQGKFTLLLVFIFMTMNVQLLFAQCERIKWQDEFTSSTLDLTKWEYEVGGGGWGTGQLDYATARPENVRIENGKLVLEIRKEDYQGHQYTSGRLRTYHTANFQYGKIEARVKGLYSQGNGFAFWLLGSDYESVIWPKCGEVDIFENTGKYPSKNIGTAHYEESWGHAWSQGTYTLPSGRWYDDFHTTAIEWSPTYIKWSIDGNVYHTMDLTNPINGYKPFNRPFFIIMSVGMGGSYSGPPDATTISPMRAEIEYVRVYEGTYSTFISGDDKIYKNEQSKDYSVNVPASGHTFSWTVPAGATITSGQGTNKVLVNWGQSGGDVKVTVGSSCGSNTYTMKVTAEEPFVADKVYENFETPPALTYGAMSGTLTSSVANPLPNTVNNSAKVGRYARNSTQQYDYITIQNINAQPIGDIVYGKRRILLDVYTDAPIGTKVSLNLENGNVATGTNYPSGRYAIFDARTTKQNQWETLEFEYTSSPDIYGSAAEVNQWILLFAPVTNSANTFHFDNLRTGQAGGIPAPVYTDVLMNYDGAALLTKDFSNGVYTVQANPSATAPNTSANVAKYVRDAASSYDALVFKTNAIEDAYNFKKGTHKIYADIYTTAPIGTRLSLNFEVSGVATPDNWPAGRHSNYEAVTTKQNQWETVVFSISSTPDKGASDASVDKFVFLFNPVTATNHTYYIDNIRRVSTVAREVFVAGPVLHDYDANNNLTLASNTGTYSPGIANPFLGGINASAKIAKYVRSAAQQWDLLVFNKNTAQIDPKALKERRQKFAFDLYTDAPVGTPITIGIDASSLATADNYPVGRHSNYQGVTKAQNAWHSVTFTFAAAPDGATPDNLVDKIALLFDPGKLTGHTYHIDNIRVLNLSVTPVLTSIVVNPGTSTVNSGQTVQFTTQGKDQNGNNMTISPAATWSVTGGGTISSSGLFTATTAGGPFTVKATSGTIVGSAQITISAPPSANLALNKPIFASTTQSGLPVTNANDGSTASRWGSEWADPQWIYVDLQNSYTINRVVLRWEAASGKNYQIQTSADALNWNSIYTTTTGDGGADDLALSGSARYVRMYGTTRNTGYGYSLFEFEVYGNNSTPVLSSIVVTPGTASIQTGATQQFTAQGKDQFGNNFASAFTWSASGGTITSGGLFTAGNSAGTFTVSAKSGSVTGNASVTVTTIPSSTNIALNKPATASSTQSGLPLTNINDGNINTRWSSNWEDPSWVTIDLLANYTINKVTLRWEAASGKNYLLQVSADNVNWNTIQNVVNGDGGEDTYNVSGTGRYVRMYGTVRNTGWGYSLWEFEIYGTLSGGRQAQRLNDSPHKDEVTIDAYPNPVVSELKISGVKTFPVIIHVYSGARLIIERKYHKREEIAIDMEHLAKGLYYIRVNEGNKPTYTGKVIKD
jgi:beta-glucanase (GH16 family)